MTIDSLLYAIRNNLVSVVQWIFRRFPLRTSARKLHGNLQKIQQMMREEDQSYLKIRGKEYSFSHRYDREMLEAAARSRKLSTYRMMEDLLTPVLSSETRKLEERFLEAALYAGADEISVYLYKKCLEQGKPVKEYWRDMSVHEGCLNFFLLSVPSEDRPRYLEKVLDFDRVRFLPYVTDITPLRATSILDTVDKIGLRCYELLMREANKGLVSGLQWNGLRFRQRVQGRAKFGDLEFIRMAKKVDEWGLVDWDFIAKILQRNE